MSNFPIEKDENLAKLIKKLESLKKDLASG